MLFQAGRGFLGRLRVCAARRRGGERGALRPPPVRSTPAASDGLAAASRAAALSRRAAAVNGAPLHVWTFDTDLRATRVLYSSIYSDVDVFVGTKASDWLSAEDAQALMAAPQRCLKERSPVHDRVSVFFDGKLRDFEIVAIPSMTDQGEAVGVTCIAVDLSEDGGLPEAPSKRSGAPRGLRSLLRRARPPASSRNDWGGVGEVAVDAALHGLRGRKGLVRLTRTEWLLLLCLLQNRGAVLTHEQIIEQVWGVAYRDAHHLLHDTVSRLRRRFLAAGLTRDPLETVHGVGYRFVEPR